MTQFCLANNRNIHTLCYNQKMIYTKWTWPNSALTITWNVRLSYWRRNILHLLCKMVKCRLIHKQILTYIMMLPGNDTNDVWGNNPTAVSRQSSPIPCICKLRVDTWVLSSLCCRWLPLLNEHRITCNVVLKWKKIKHVTFLWIFVVFTDKLFIIFGPKYITMDF